MYQNRTAATLRWTPARLGNSRSSRRTISAAPLSSLMLLFGREMQRIPVTQPQSIIDHRKMLALRPHQCGLGPIGLHCTHQVRVTPHQQSPGPFAVGRLGYFGSDSASIKRLREPDIGRLAADCEGHATVVRHVGELLAAAENQEEDVEPIVDVTYDRGQRPAVRANGR